MENKVVLVTGSSRGIGKATIIEFASKCKLYCEENCIDINKKISVIA